MTPNSNPTTHLDWPADELEYINECPVCSSNERSLTVGNAEDDCFRATGGKWNYYTCNSCKCLYLTPRPTQESIHKAYANYYTHAEQSLEDPAVEKYRKQGPLRRMRTRAIKTYVEERYGVKSVLPKGNSRLARVLYPSRIEAEDRIFRSLPKPSKPSESKLLDFGCGSGNFLSLAKTVGYQTEGVEFDTEAADVARARGHNVHLGGLESLSNLPPESFDVVTMFHVIEHLYDALDHLQACYALLRPGGTFIIETPNCNAIGLEKFGKHWRGLEAPRHLTIFNRPALIKILSKVGFGEIEDISQSGVSKFMYLSSTEINNGLLPLCNTKLSLKQKLERNRFVSLGEKNKNAAEFIALICVKPKDKDA